MAVSNRITIFQPGKEPQVCELDAFQKGVVRLGRGAIHGSGNTAPVNDIVIGGEAAFVSRAQCSFYFDQGRWFLLDDNSKNGMWFQDRKTGALELHDGDQVYIGESVEKRLAILFSSRRAAEADRVESYSLRGVGRFVIGRDPGCNIVLRHPTVSRRHCVITEENGQYYISDNNSTNGVILNGVLLQRRERLNPMDKITIADTTLFFSDESLYLNKPAGGVGVSAEHLFRVVGKKGEEKCITNDVSLTIRPNEFVAIVGGSGAGKTTLLNCLSGMTGFTSGEIYINGESISTAGKSLRSLMGYVPQQDIVYDTLTLERMLYYSALLRMPKDTSAEEIAAKIDETLETVELSEHRKTFISKLSGGQRKRASIAVELLASPKLFFLDEPSSGLDPGTEKHLMQMLKRLSESGKTVVMVTHTVQNIDLCDRLVCMGKGGLLCYSGPPSEVAAFFGKGRVTDIYDDLNENAEAVAERFRSSDIFHGQEARQSAAPIKAPQKDKSAGVLLRQFWVMTRRYAEIMKNSVPRLLLLLLMPVILTLLVCVAFQADGGLYNKLGINIVRENFPFLVAKDTMSLVSAFSCAAFWIGIFNSIQEISKERNIYEREKFTGVAVLPYLFSKFAILTLLCVVQSLIMAGILWGMSHTVATVDAGRNAITDMAFGIGTEGVVFPGSLWLEIFLTTFLCVLSAMCLGLAISSMVSNDMALVLCPICLLPQILFSGVAAPLSGLTDMFSRIISCRWSCIGFLTSVNLNKMYESCSFDKRWLPVETESGIVNAAYSADTTYLFGLNPVSSAWVAFGLICLVCVAAAYVVLRYRRMQTR